MGITKNTIAKLGAPIFTAQARQYAHSFVFLSPSTLANAKGIVDVPHLKKEIDKLDQLIIDIKSKYLRPDRED